MDDQLPDGLLEDYLAAEEEGEAERRLAQILDEVAAPVIRRIAAPAIRGGDAEDVVADTLLELLRRLRDLRRRSAPPIRDLRRYIAMCAYHRCHERLRERFPARTRLRNQLRYLCGHHPALALWRDDHGQLLCGTRTPGPQSPDVPSGELPALVLELVAPAPQTLESLTTAVAGRIGLEEAVEVPLDDLHASSATSIDVALDARMSLKELWGDVRLLSPKQRIALLLNLRDVHGRECLSLFPLTRTATIAEIAEAVDIPAEELAALWNGLPLADAAIGELLGMTARQVIKLRRLARERLRRMAASRADRNVVARFDSLSSRGQSIAGRR